MRVFADQVTNMLNEVRRLGNNFTVKQFLLYMNIYMCIT